MFQAPKSQSDEKAGRKIELSSALNINK